MTESDPISPETESAWDHSWPVERLAMGDPDHTTLSDLQEAQRLYERTRYSGARFWGELLPAEQAQLVQVLQIGRRPLGYREAFNREAALVRAVLSTLKSSASLGETLEGAIRIAELTFGVSGEPLYPTKLHLVRQLRKHRRATWNRPEEDEFELALHALEVRLGLLMEPAAAPEPTARASDQREPLQPSSPDLIAKLRRAVNAAIFGIPAEAIAGIQDDITELARRLGNKP
jgi:hypothetical protein